LLNRRAFLEQGEIMLERARRYQHSLAVIMLDLDMFKLVNDSYGHDAGDRLLCEVADQCKLITRKVDLCARMGGEEFALMIDGADADQAVQIADRLRTMIYKLHRGTSMDPASASFGVSVFRDQDETVNALLSSADRVLYVAKETGRNRVVLDTAPLQLVA
jgi:diguanylate cyclase (GGDEF)-like protein